MGTTVNAAGPLEASVRDLNKWSHKELMALPVRKWDEEKEYDSLLLVSTRKKHDSGWAVIAIIGVREFQPEEIACACCDDIEWKLPPMQTFGGGPLDQEQDRCGTWEAAEKMHEKMMERVRGAKAQAL